MQSPLVLFLIAAAVMTVIDLFWLGIVARKMYRKYIGFLLAPKTNVPAAILFYVIFIIGLVAFVIVPALDATNQVQHAVGYGLLWGLCTYATYDLTNLATVKNWPVTLTIIDLAWGSFISAAVATVTVLIAR